MPQKLIVRGFGPLKNIEIVLKDINVFIGETASGKSVLSKISAIFTSTGFLRNIDKNNFVESLKHYDIDIYLKNGSYIRFENSGLYIEYNDHKLKTNFPYQTKKPYANSFGNIIDYLVELQRYLHEVICSDKKAYHVNGDIWESIYNFTKSLKTQITEKKTVDEIEIIEKEIIEFEKSKEKNGIFDTEKELQLAFKIYELLKNIGFHITETIYVPSERAYISTLSNSLFSIIKDGIALPKCLTDFGANFEQARNKLKTHKLNILNIEYKFENNRDIIHLPKCREDLLLTQVSSGMQAVIPMLLVLENTRGKLRIVKNCYVIEEPELNLFPDLQKQLIELIIELFFNPKVIARPSSIISQDKLDMFTAQYIDKKDRLIISTHSPYILTALDNLIQAQNTVNKKPNHLKKVAEIIPENKWIDIDNVSAYYFKDGSAIDIIDHEMKSLGANRIDDVSEDIGKTYDKLLNIMFGDE